MTIEWDNDGLYVNYTHGGESAVLYKFREPNLPDTIRGLFENKLQYISVLGSPTLMRITIPDGGTKIYIQSTKINV